MGLVERVRRNLVGRRRGERDAPAMNAGPRESGGTEAASTQDRTSSTGTSPNDTFVGRVGGDEAGDVGTSGAGRRTGREPGAGDGAARND
jgi:hypothetical protein